MTRLDEIRARLKKATPGPWRTVTSRIEVQEPESLAFARAEVRGDEDHCGYHTVCAFEERLDGIPFRDADFIAHSRADLEWAVAEIERLRKVEEAARAYIDAADAEGAAGIAPGYRAFRAALEGAR